MTSISPVTGQFCPVNQTAGQLAIWPFVAAGREVLNSTYTGCPAVGATWNPVCPARPSEGLVLTMPPVELAASDRFSPLEPTDTLLESMTVAFCVVPFPYQVGDHTVWFSEPPLNSSSKTRLVGTPIPLGALGAVPLVVTGRGVVVVVVVGATGVVVGVVVLVGVLPPVVVLAVGAGATVGLVVVVVVVGVGVAMVVDVLVGTFQPQAFSDVTRRDSTSARACACPWALMAEAPP